MYSLGTALCCQVVQLPGLAYWHQGSVVLPRHLRPPASALLGEGLDEPPFDEPDDNVGTMA